MKARHGRIREVLGDGEGGRVDRQPRQGDRSQVLLDMAQQRLAEPLPVVHPS